MTISEKPFDHDAAAEQARSDLHLHRVSDRYWITHVHDGGDVEHDHGGQAKEWASDV